MLASTFVFVSFHCNKNHLHRHQLFLFFLHPFSKMLWKFVWTWISDSYRLCKVSFAQSPLFNSIGIRFTNLNVFHDRQCYSLNECAHTLIRTIITICAVVFFCISIAHSKQIKNIDTCFYVHFDLCSPIVLIICFNFCCCWFCLHWSLYERRECVCAQFFFCAVCIA